MLTDGIKSIGGYAEKLSIVNGGTLPTVDLVVGQLFYKTGSGAGLYVYNADGWALAGGGGVGGGVGGENIVYLDDIQTLTNKTLAQPKVNGLVETCVALAANNIDVSQGAVFTKTISGATTLIVSGAPAAGKVSSFILKLTNGGSAVVTWWAGIKWDSGTAPTLTVSGKDNLAFYTDDGGATWEGFVLSKDSK